MGLFIFWLIIIASFLAMLLSMINIVPQASAYVIERLGKYKSTWQAGIHLKIPVIDRISTRCEQGIPRLYRRREELR